MERSKTFMKEKKSRWPITTQSKYNINIWESILHDMEKVWQILQIDAPQHQSHTEDCSSHTDKNM